MNQIYTLTLNPAVDRELIVPRIEYDRVLRATTNHVDFGGKGFNVSRMLQALGSTSIALGFVGGKSGELLKEGLESLGIITDFVWIDDETRTNVSIKTESDTHYIKVNEPGPNISNDKQEALIEKITGLCRIGDWWILAGSLPPGIPDSYYARLIRIIQDAGGKAILDTSGKALMEGCLSSPYLVKPNEVELQDISQMPVNNMTDILQAGESLQKSGIQAVVVSLGKRGALLIAKGQNWLVKSPKIKERNPIGAGDSMVGGLTWGLQQQYNLLESVRWGVACGAAAASLSGTAVGPLNLVKRLYSETETEPLTQ